MSFQTAHKRKFDDLKCALHTDFRIQLKREANGGNTILLAFPPAQEGRYIAKAEELYVDACFIDISRLFVQYIDSVGYDAFEEFYRAYQTTPDQVFKNDDDDNLFIRIIDAIKAAAASDRIPFIIRTGALHGTGIVNQHIMDDNHVLRLKQPLVFFYPAELENDTLLFLNFKPASKYRCKLIM